MSSVWFDGVDELNTVAAQLGKAGVTGAAKAAVVVRRTAAAIEGTAKGFAPVDTGALRNSIGSSIGAAGLEAQIGATAAYAPFVEFGTARHGPQAFLGPALDRHTPDFIAGLEQIGDITT